MCSLSSPINIRGTKKLKKSIKGSDFSSTEQQVHVLVYLLVKKKNKALDYVLVLPHGHFFLWDWPGGFQSQLTINYCCLTE